MADISDDRWSCPRCGALWTRSRYQDIAQWQTAVRGVQAAHGARCARTESTR